MLARLTVMTFLVVLAVACGGGSSATGAPAGTGAPTGTNGASTSPPVVGGDEIDAAAITAAVDALEAKDSWQFEGRYVTAGLEDGFETNVSGTERPPESAVDAQHEQPDGSLFRYIRIGDDIWYDVGNGTFAHVQAEGAENLIEQYEPYYLSSLADSAQSQSFEFDLVGAETVNGIATNHYRLSESDRERIVDNYDDITADQWGGDVWIATDGAYLVGLNWGPQTVDTAQVTIGFSYVVTAVDCECPIEPPT